MVLRGMARFGWVRFGPVGQGKDSPPKIFLDF